MHKHVITVDCVIEKHESGELVKTRNHVLLYNNETVLSNRLLSRLFYSKSVLLASKHPGVYITDFSIQPIMKCELTKIIKNKNLKDSLVLIADKNVQYVYKTQTMEFEEEKLEQEVKVLPKNNFRKITNLLTSHKNELKQLGAENGDLKVQLFNSQEIVAKQKDALIELDLDYQDLKTQWVNMNGKNMILIEENETLKQQISEFIGELEAFSITVENELVVSVECSIDKAYMRCERLSLPFKIVDNALIFTETVKAKISAPRDVIIALSRQSECIQSQGLLEKQFLSGDVIRVSGSYTGEFYLDITFN